VIDFLLEVELDMPNQVNLTMVFCYIYLSI